MIVHSISKYINTHPYITPEGYQTHLYEPGVVRALYLSSDYQYSPFIITDTPYNILSSIFLGEQYDDVYPDIHYHACYALHAQSLISKPNYIATTLIRNSYLLSTGITVTDAIYGDVVLFGSFNHRDNRFDEGHYSIPYEIVEQAFRIDNIKTKLY
jgi:hypothetical protein